MDAACLAKGAAEVPMLSIARRMSKTAVLGRASVPEGSVVGRIRVPICVIFVGSRVVTENRVQSVLEREEFGIVSVVLPGVPPLICTLCPEVAQHICIEGFLVLAAFFRRSTEMLRSGPGGGSY